MAKEVEILENGIMLCGKTNDISIELKEISKNSEDNFNETSVIISSCSDDEKPEKNEILKDETLEEIVTEKTDISVDLLDKGNRRVINSRNTYAAKKTVAQGMMDVALITANANQLRYLIEYQRTSSTFYLNVVLIICSLLLQVAVGISLIFKGRFDIRGESKSPGARRINNYVVVGVFLTTIINVFVAAFSVSTHPLPPSNVIPVSGKMT